MPPPPTHTARDLVTASLKRLGVIAGSETPSADLISDGLDRLNGLLGTWATESLVVWAETTLSPAVTPLVPHPGQHYTVGPGGDISVAVRPPALDQVSLLMADGVEHILEPLSRESWVAERWKTLSGPLPSAWFYNPLLEVGHLAIWPTYSGGDVQSLRLYVPQTVTTVALDTDLILPPGYYRALRDALAVELVPEFPGRALDPLLLKIATDAKAQLERTNFSPRTLGLPAALTAGCGGHYNWLTDEGA